jgi:hypothetical protein
VFGFLTCKNYLENCAFDIKFTSPTIINIVLGNWLNGLAKKDKIHIHVGMYDLHWEIWNVCNDVFTKKYKTRLFCRLFLWIPTRSICGPMSNQRKTIVSDCNQLELVAPHINTLKLSCNYLKFQARLNAQKGNFVYLAGLGWRSHGCVVHMHSM